jgi:hypothetical protein
MVHQLNQVRWKLIGTLEHKQWRMDSSAMSTKDKLPPAHKILVVRGLSLQIVGSLDWENLKRIDCHTGDSEPFLSFFLWVMLYVSVVTL